MFSKSQADAVGPIMALDENNVADLSHTEQPKSSLTLARTHYKHFPGGLILQEQINDPSKFTQDCRKPGSRIFAKSELTD